MNVSLGCIAFVNELQDIHNLQLVYHSVCSCVSRESVVAFIRFSEGSLVHKGKAPLLWDLGLGLTVRKAVAGICWAPTVHQAPLMTLHASFHLSLQTL